MSLTRYFPSPSDRMAIIWSLLPIEDGIVLEYGPAGTTHFGGGLYGSLGFRMRGRLYTTHISEDDVVMGDVSRLEKAILEIDAMYAPKVIFVVASAVIAVIGTDVKGVCMAMQDQVHARLIAFEDGGFRGDYTYGLRAVNKLLIKEFTEKTGVTEEKSYQILGASAGSYRIRSDVWELQQLMTEAFGWHCRLVLGLESTTEQLRTAGQSALNLVIRTEARDIAETLKKQSGTPYVYGAPYGYEGTLKWLESISQVIGQPINPELQARLEEKIADNAPATMGGPMGMMHRREPVAVLSGDYDVIVGLAGAMREMEVDVACMDCHHSLKAVPNSNGEVTVFPREKDRLDYFGSVHHAWVLGDNIIPNFCGEDNFYTPVSFPFEGLTQYASHLPIMGEKGMDWLMEQKNLYFRNCGI